MTEWLARLGREYQGTRTILCGRVVQGHPGCDGIIARWFPTGEVRLPPGFAEVEPGFWAPGKRLLSQVERGQLPLGRRRTGGRRATKAGMAELLGPPVSLPFRRRCPTCNTTALVTHAVLSSELPSGR